MSQKQVCCFTGHRAIPAKNRDKLQKALDNEIRRLIGEGTHQFMTGGAMGFDTMAAQSVLKFREEFPDVSLTLVLPHKYQTSGWSAEDKATYKAILAEANDVVYTAERYYPGCMIERNHYMVDHSGTCICYLTRTGGGSFSMVQYAKQCGIAVINIAQ